MSPAPPGAFPPRHSPSGSRSEHQHHHHEEQGNTPEPQPQHQQDDAAPFSPSTPLYQHQEQQEPDQLQQSQLLPAHPPVPASPHALSDHGTSSSSPAEPAGDGDNGDMPMTMAASVVLAQLPRDARGALEKAALGPEAEGERVEKVTVRFRPVGSAPQLRQPVAKVSASSRFETVVRFLRRRLGVQDNASVFCYVNSVFAPGLDEGVGNLWRCFKTKDELVVAYSITPAFG